MARIHKFCAEFILVIFLFLLVNTFHLLYQRKHFLQHVNVLSKEPNVSNLRLYGVVIIKLSLYPVKMDPNGIQCSWGELAVELIIDY